MVNKDIKSAVERPSRENMNRMSLYLGDQMKLPHNLQTQVDKSQFELETEQLKCIYTMDKPTIKSLQNVRTMISKIEAGDFLPLSHDTEKPFHL